MTERDRLDEALTMTEPQQDFRVPLAEGVREGMKRNPLAVIFVLAVLGIVLLGWQILAETSRERTELQERIAQLTDDLVHCHQLQNARQKTTRALAEAPVRTPASVSSQSNTSP